jgi:hypothetical protein
MRVTSSFLWNGVRVIVPEAEPTPLSSINKMRKPVPFLGASGTVRMSVAISQSSLASQAQRASPVATAAAPLWPPAS